MSCLTVSRVNFIYNVRYVSLVGITGNRGNYRGSVTPETSNPADTATYGGDLKERNALVLIGFKFT